MVEEFKRDHGRLTGLAATFREVPELAAAPDEDDGARVYPEGRYAYRIHRSRERSPRLARDKKRQAAQHGRLACEVCGLAPEQLYPENGDRALECHHIIPLSSLSGVKSTRLEDLALVCASCHRVLHSSNPPVVPVTLSKSLTATVRLEGRGA
jgi:5-methylcytosine-specific restriction protein A